MKSLLAILGILLLTFTISCTGSPTTPENNTEESINFMVSSNHFVKNTYSGDTNPSYLIIRDYTAFESVFGVGAVMGMDSSSLITEDGMQKSFVLSIIYQGNDIHEFDIEKITLSDGQLKVYYTSEVTEPDASWTCNCHITVLVDNCDFDSVLLYENGKALPDAVITYL